jgi:hypothetical protein
MVFQFLYEPPSRKIKGNGSLVSDVLDQIVKLRVFQEREHSGLVRVPVVHHQMAERTQIQLQAVTHMFFSQALPIQISRSARLRFENARRS